MSRPVSICSRSLAPSSDELSVAQLRRRVDALRKIDGPPGVRVYTSLEEPCRELWRMDKRRFEKAAREGDLTLAFFLKQFTMEEAEGRFVA